MSRSAPLQPAATAVASHASPTSGVLMRKCACGNKSGNAKCDACKNKEEEGLHRKAAGPVRDSEAPSIVHDVVRGPGQMLDAGTRVDMERRFGHDFSQVRVHTDARAAESARAVSALAYTVGQHVVFGSSQFSPTTTAGRHLLAHELAHTVQQRGTGARRQHRLIVRDHDSADERAADRAADIAVRGGRVSQAMPTLATSDVTAGGAVQRKGGLLSPQEVDAVYQAWVAEIQRSRGTMDWLASDEVNVRERLKKQVGPGNYANYMRWQEAEQEKQWAKAEEENKPKPPVKVIDLVTAQNERYDEMWEATEALRAEIVRVEKLAKKLDFGKGAGGTVSRLTAGAYTGVYGIGSRTVASVGEHAPMMILGAAGTALGSDTAEEFLVSQGQAVKQEGEEMGDDARTAVRLVGGDLQAAYDATRPSYDRYWEALKTFGKHRSDFRNKHQDLYGTSLAMARGGYLAGMESAMKDMKEAGNDFLMKCAQLGIENDAKALNKMGDNIIKGSEAAVETAVGALPGVAPGLKQVKNAVKGGKGMGAKQLLKEATSQADDVVAAGAKKADDVVSAGAKKADDVISAGAKQADDVAASGARQADDAVPGGAGKVDEAPGAGSGHAAPAKREAAPNLKSPKDAPPKKVPAADNKALKENVHNARKVTDPKFRDQGYVTEIPIGDHTYRRHRDGTWCRFSTAQCNFQMDPEFEKRFANWVEEGTKQGPAKVRRPRPAPDTGHGKAARDDFDQVREGYVKQLGAKSGEDIHHAIELQALDRYPGVFSSRELNGFKNMRGIPGEVKLTAAMEEEIAKRGLKPGSQEYSDFVEPQLGRRKQLHNSKIRDTWDRHYVQLDDDIAALGLKEGTVEYRKYVRRYMESARREIDELYEAFFTEVQRGKKQWKGAGR